MAWIHVVPEDEATGRLKELYEKYREPWGGVDHIISIHSLNVRSMMTHYDLYAHLMRGRSDLSRAQREMIAVVASAANRCHY
jgi:alkylhydroperoxidase family enzyme